MVNMLEYGSTPLLPIADLEVCKWRGDIAVGLVARLGVRFERSLSLHAL